MTYFIKISLLFVLIYKGLDFHCLMAKENHYTFSFQNAEEEVWKQVTNENTLDAYQRYTIEYPDGKYSYEAVEKIVMLRDENAWKDALEKNTSSAYRKYLSFYPRGLHVEEAKAASRKLANNTKTSSTTSSNNSRGNDRTNTATTPSNSNSSPTNSVVNNPPPATERPKAQPKQPTPTPVKPAVDPEEELWKIAVQTGTEESYKNYLTTYPSGKYIENAVPRVPMEFDLQRSNAVDSVFVLNIKYAEQPVTIQKVEIPREMLAYTPAEEPSSLTMDTLFDGTLVNQYKWNKGRFSADITSLDPITTEIILTLGREQKYELLLSDDRNNIKSVELEGALSPLELLGVIGYETENDTLFLTIRGGKPDYYVRIVELGKDVNDFLHEEILKPDRYDNTWYLAKPNLIRENKIPSGNYDVYVVDSRKLESIKYTRSVAFGTGHLISNMEFRKFLLFPLAILVLLILVRWLRSTRNASGSRYRKFKF